MQTKTAYITGGIIILGAFAVAGFIFYSGLSGDKAEVLEVQSPYQAIAESNGMVLMADAGLDIEWLINKEDGRRQVFERYRLVKKEDFENYTGTETIINSVDISRNNAAVFLTPPEGKSEEMSSDAPYMLFSILPPMPAGEYKLNINLNSGENYEFNFELKEPREVEFADTGKIIEQQKPEEGEGIVLSMKEQILLNELEGRERESRILHAFKLGNLDLRESSSTYHIMPEGEVRGGSLAEVRSIHNIDEYFWLDTEGLNLEHAEREEFVEAVGELENPDPDTAYELERLRNLADEHIFLAKINGVWHYAVKTYPF